MEEDLKRIYIVNLELTEEAKELTKQDYITTHIVAPYRLDICNILELVKKQYGQQNVKSISIKNTIYPDFEYLKTIKENDIVAIRSLNNDYVNIREVYRVSERSDGKILIEFWDGCFLMDTGLDPHDKYSCYLDKPTEKEIQNFKNRRDINIKVADIKRWANETDDIETINTVWDIINKKEEGN